MFRIWMLSLSLAETPTSGDTEVPPAAQSLAAETPAQAMYAAARTAANGDTPNESYSLLDRAWAAGFADLQLVESDTAFTSLHGTEDWNRWVAGHRASVEVRVDPRVELLHIVFFLAGAEEFRTAPADQPHIQRIEAYFAKVADHRAVQLAQELRRTVGASYNAPCGLAFALDDATTPALRTSLSPFPDHLDSRWDSAQTVPFLEALADFARDSDFTKWRADTAVWRIDLERAVDAAVQKENPQSWFDTGFAHSEDGKLLIVPDLISWQNNYAATAIPTDGARERLAVLGSLPWDEHSQANSLGRHTDILVHEMAHEYVGPILEEQWSSVSHSADKLFKRVREPMSRGAYGDSKTVANESLTRALTQIYMRDRHSPNEVAEHLARNARQGFHWIEELADLLESHRKDGVFDLAAAMPETSELFLRWAKKKHSLEPSWHTINSVLEQSTTLGVYSAEHPDLRSYVDDISFWKGKTVDSVDALPTTGVLYGSPSSIPLVAEALAANGITLDAGGLSLPSGKRIEGGDVVLIAALVYQKRKLVVYTAFRNEHVIDANSLFHGPYTVTVGQAGEVVYATNLTRH